jgi:hypothetical protein
LQMMFSINCANLTHASYAWYRPGTTGLLVLGSGGCDIHF